MYNYMLKGKIVEKFGVQWKFAQHLGIDEAGVSKIITGRIKLSPKRKREFAKALQCQPGEIFED